MFRVCRQCKTVTHTARPDSASYDYLCDHCAQRGEPVAATAPKARGRKRRKSKRPRAPESSAS